MLKLLLLLAVAQAQTRACPKAAPDEVPVHVDDFSWGQPAADMAKNFEELQSAGRRLFGRAYFDPELKKYVFDSDKGPILIDDKFLASVTKHAEIALNRGYSKHLFFPDMGHSHFYIPEADWPTIMKAEGRKATYEALMGLRSMKILYHTAEQLQMRDGEHGTGAFIQDKNLLWRYFTRNMVGDNNGGENVYPLFNFTQNPDYNTVGEMEGYKLYSAGFYISESKNGCFPFQRDGKTFYFDLSLEEMPPKNPGDGSN